MIHIGDVLVHKGEPQDGNPYKGFSMMGQNRKNALTAFKNNQSTGTCTFWYAPANGGARKIEANEIDWSSSGL